VSRAEAKARVYRSVEELPEVLEPGRYVIGEAVVELEEQADRRFVEKLVRLARRLREMGAEPL